jgi:hypothetical protein
MIVNQRRLATSLAAARAPLRSMACASSALSSVKTWTDLGPRLADT